MSTYSRARSRRQQRHPASRSKSHRLDKQQGETRQRTSWVGVEAPERPSQKRDFRGLEGHEYIFDEQGWKRCQNPESFADLLERKGRECGWYVGQTYRKGVPVSMRRPVATPVEVLTVSFEPALSDWTAAEIAAGRDPRRKLAAIRNLWLQSAQEKLAGQRYLLGYAFHADTDDLHFDLVCTRQDGKGGRIGRAGLGLVGPWMTSVDRQIRAGASIGAEKRSQFTRSVANFHHRSGKGVVPLDVTLARSLDKAADAVLGAEIVPFRQAYAARVPELELQHAEAQLATLEAVRDKLVQQVAPPSPGPDIPDAMHMPEPNSPSPGM